MDSKNSSGRGRFARWLAQLATWFIPGLGVKRWILVILLGTTLVGIGLGVVILDFYRNAPDTWWLPVLSTLSLRELSRPLRAVIFGGIGLAIIGFGIWKLNRALIRPFLRPGSRMADAIWTHRQLEKGPRIVAIGGGHGLAAALRGLKSFSRNITAIVTVADDGGSSGRLRQELGILPPGDIRNCLAALSNDEALLSQLFQYRFPDGDSGLEGHSFGNLFITAMAEITGSFEEAVAESGRVLAVHGQVLPATLHDVRLSADIRLPDAVGEVRIQGESQITKTPGKVNRIWLEPNNPPAYPEAIQAVLAADLIVIGPGSLYTSILPNLLVPDLTEAVRASKALKLYVCNLATEPGETDHYTCGDHVHVLEDHLGSCPFDIAIANSAYDSVLPDNVDCVVVEPGLEEEFNIYAADLVDTLYPWRHDAQKLAQVIMDLYQERTGPLVE
jgi:uncharacterized cofD-like protein